MRRGWFLALWGSSVACGSADSGTPGAPTGTSSTGTETTSTTATGTPAGSPAGTPAGTAAGTPAGVPYEVDVHPRSEWEEPGYEVTGPEQLEEIDFIIVHYPGADFGASLTLTMQLVQDAQRDWTDSRGYSLGYNWIVGRGGLDDVWEVRGFEYRNAANGPVDPPNPDLGTNGNDHTVAVKFITNLDGELSPEQLEAGPVIANWLRQHYGRPLEARPHSWVKPTACPGDPMRQLLTEGWMDT
jgi:hypothetical protein